MTSPRLVIDQNIPGHLATLDGRSLIGPQDEALWPDPHSLKWHLRERFRKF